MATGNPAAFPKGRWNFDGHGINVDGARILKDSTDAYDSVSGTPVRRKEFDQRNEQLARFCTEGHRMEIRSFTHDDPERRPHPPTIFLEIDEEEFKRASQHTVMVVEVRRKDGKKARASLVLSKTDSTGKLTAGLYTPTQRQDRKVERQMTFADWKDD